MAENVITITIESCERTGSQGQAGPEWAVTSTAGEVYAIPAGTAGGYAVGNPGMREGSRVELILSPAGDVVKIRAAR